MRPYESEVEERIALRVLLSCAYIVDVAEKSLGRDDATSTSAIDAHSSVGCSGEPEEVGKLCDHSNCYTSSNYVKTSSWSLAVTLKTTEDPLANYFVCPRPRFALALFAPTSSLCPGKSLSIVKAKAVG